MANETTENELNQTGEQEPNTSWKPCPVRTVT